MGEGIVRFYSHQRGFGFITPDDRRGDLFVHQTDVATGGFRRLAEKQRVAFEVANGPRGPRAVRVRPL